MSPAEGAGRSGGAGGYEWARASAARPVTPLPRVGSPPAHGLDAGLDHIVKLSLDRTGLMDRLDEVTGKLDQLTEAALEWQAQAAAVREVAQSLRSGAVTLSGEWEGQASASFGAHLGKVVAAVEGTAADMDRTAWILSRAASECRTAQDTVVELIREAIETLVATLAGMVVIDIVTLGLATAADALLAEAEIAVFIARVARVSEELSRRLGELMRAVREIRTFGADLGDGLRAAKAVRQLGGMASTGKAAGSLVRTPSMARAGDVLATQGVKHYNDILKTAASPLGKGDVVGPLKDALTSDTGVEAVKRRSEGARPEAPYRVPTSGTGEAGEAFG